MQGLTVVTAQAFEDERGFFLEAYRADAFAEAGLPAVFAQWNHSRSARGVVRGLHFQWEPPMAKYMRVTAGEAQLVAVDIRPDSPTLGQPFSVMCSAKNRVGLFAEAGFARGFAALEDGTEIEYLCTGIYNPRGEAGIRWDDPAIGLRWPFTEPIISAKDAATPLLSEWLRRPEAQRFRVVR